MRLNKIKDTYNDYKLEVSWGQLEALKNALADTTPDPVVDELAAELEWYMNNVPGPGVDEEEYKAQEEQANSALPDAGDEDDGSPIPMPPDEEPIETIAGEGPVEEPGGGPEEIDLEAEETEPLPGGGEADFRASEQEELPEPPRE